MSANNQQAAGEAAGAKNLLNAGMSLASLAAGSFGGGGMFAPGGSFAGLLSGGAPQMVGGYNVSQTGGGHPFYPNYNFKG
jgi:hypothetical protein